MNNKFILFVLGLFPIIINAQTRCGYESILNYYEVKQPGYKAAASKAFDENLLDISTRAFEDSVYTIQVVVHVVYKTPAQNLPDSVIQNQIRILNLDYSRLNDDTINLRQEFFPIRAKDSKIRFELASKDPQGNATSGIVRKLTTKTTFLDLFGGGIAEDVKNTSTGGSDPWDQSKYLNIWVCNMDFLGTPFILGYATPPLGLPNWDSSATSGLGDGVVIQFQFFGSNNPNPPGTASYIVKGRTVTHEVGHYLGLRHIWGDGTGSGACDGDDGIADTPSADEASDQSTACSVVTNSCTQSTLSLGDLNDMTENYMDYSGEQCQNSFTKGQAEFMHNVIVTKRKGITKNTTSMKKIGEKNFSYYPNPASTSLTIKLNEAYNVKAFKITDVLGNTKYEADEIKELMFLDLSAYTNGFYFLQTILKDGTNSIEKLCINR